VNLIYLFSMTAAFFCGVLLTLWLSSQPVTLPDPARPAETAATPVGSGSVNTGHEGNLTTETFHQWANTVADSQQQPLPRSQEVSSRAQVNLQSIPEPESGGEWIAINSEPVSGPGENEN
jgi:hypothetical protein